MKGTSFSLTLPMRLMPPSSTMATSMATKMPTMRFSVLRKPLPTTPYSSRGGVHSGYDGVDLGGIAGRGGGDCRDNEAEADDAQGRLADGNGLGVGGEQADEGAGDGQAEDGANGHDGGAQAQRQVVEPGDAAMPLAP